MLNLATIVEMNAREHPDQTAIICGGWRLTHRELNEAANQLAHGLQESGVNPGDKIALTCPTNPYFPICYYGIMKAGAVVVPLNTLLKSSQVANLLGHCDAVGYLCYEGSEQLPMGREGWAAFQDTEGCRQFWLIPGSLEGKSFAEPGMSTWSELVDDRPTFFDTVQMQGDAPCCILYTSGTTGEAKGAELSHDNVLYTSLAFKEITRYSPDEVFLIAAPLASSFAQILMLNPVLCAGGRLVLLPRFEPGRVWEAIQEHRVTAMCGVPTMFWAMYQYPGLGQCCLDAISEHWRLGLCGGAPVPPGLLKAFRDKFHVAMLQGYGLTETCAITAITRLNRKSKPGSTGWPIWGAAMRVVDGEMNEMPVGEAGEIVVRGYHVMKGYYKNPKANEEAFRGGWFHTGDLGKMDEDGAFQVVGRIKEIIIRAGHNIHPKEVEDVLMAHPGISIASVVGVPDERVGEELKAYVVLSRGAVLSPADIIAWASERLAAYAYPRLVEITDSLPTGPTGKVLKTELFKWHAAAGTGGQAPAAPPPEA